MTAARQLTRQQILERLSGERGQPLTPLSWWAPAFAALDDPGIYELILVLPRQSGKSQWLAAAALAEVFTTRDAYVLLVSASQQQQEAVFLRKIRRPLEHLLRQLGLTGAVRITQRGLEVASMGSVLECVAPNEARPKSALRS